MMKKRIRFCLAVCLVLALMLPVLAAEDPAMTISAPENAAPGETITVTVSINSVADCTAAGLGVQYDSTVFEMVEDSFTILAENIKQASFKYVANAKGYVANLQMDGAQSVSGELFSFQLKVLETATLGSSYTISGTPSLRISNAMASCAIESATLTCACNHSYGSWSEKDAQNHVRKCTKCGTEQSAQHIFGAAEVTQEPTCTAEGIKTFTCTDCGATKTESVAKIDHSYDGGVVTTEPGCTTEGIKTFTCSCGHTETEKIDALGHSCDDGVITKEPTCDEDGVKTYSCRRSGCSYTETEPLAPLGHSYDQGRITKAPTCEEDGVKTYTCIHDGCSITRTETEPKLGHEKGDPSEENRREPTCTAEGSYELAVYCTRCSKELERTGYTLEKLEHTYDSGVITTQPTCVSEGIRTRTCTGCGHSYTVPVSKLEHFYDSGKVTTQPTCTAEGVKTFTCAGCGTTYTEPVAMIDHYYDHACDRDCNGCGLTRETTHKYADTYSSDEKTHWYACKICGDRKDEYAHTPGPEATDWDPQLCVICGYVIEPAHGHTHAFSEEYTYDADGHWFACAGCSEQGNYQVHEFDHDCDEICDTCGYTRQIEHRYSERLTYDENGHWHACDICGDVMELLPHNPGPEATEQTDQICLDCGFIIHPAGFHEHSPNGDWHSSDAEHWHQCACGEVLERSVHTWDEGKKDENAGTVTYHCTECGYPRTENLPPVQTQPSEPAEPDPTQPADPGDSTQKPVLQIEWWMIVVAAICVLLLGGIIFVIVGILVSRRKTGKYSR